MKNFFLDNNDLQFILQKINIDEPIKYREKQFTEFKKYHFAPQNLQEAKENYEKILELVGDISCNLISPRSGIIDKYQSRLVNGKIIQHHLMHQNIEDLKKADLFGVTINRNFGGLNFPMTIYIMMIEIISRGDASLQNIFGLQGIAEIIEEFGTEKQKQYYLPKLTSGLFDSSMVFTEPHYGSDLQSIQLCAEFDEKNNIWLLNGTKHFITNGGAKVNIVLARSEKNTKDGRGLSLFICESCPELVVNKIENKLGLHGVPTTELQFNNVKAELFGKQKRGLIKYVPEILNGGRISVSAQALGIAESAFRLANEYAKNRIQFATPIINIPTIYSMLTNMKLSIISSRALLYETSKIYDYKKMYDNMINKIENDNKTQTQEEKINILNKQKYYNKLLTTLVPMCKAYITESANKIVYNAVQIHGGIGYMNDCKITQLYRDIRTTNIYEGTTQIQNVIASNYIIQGHLDKKIEEYLQFFDKQKSNNKEYKTIKKMHIQLYKILKLIKKNQKKQFLDIVNKYIVKLSTYLLIGCIMFKDSSLYPDRKIFTKMYIACIIHDFKKYSSKIINNAYIKLTIKHKCL